METSRKSSGKGGVVLILIVLVIFCVFYFYTKSTTQAIPKETTQVISSAPEEHAKALALTTVLNQKLTSLPKECILGQIVNKKDDVYTVRVRQLYTEACTKDPNAPPMLVYIEVNLSTEKTQVTSVF